MSSTEFTERDWLDSADAVLLLDQLFPMRGFHSTPEQPRKLRLYYAGCARRAHRGLNSMQRAMLDAAERVADGELPKEHLAEVAEMADNMANAYEVRSYEISRLGVLLNRDPELWNGGESVRDEDRDRFNWLIHQSLYDFVPPTIRVHRSLHSADLVREVFSNPFRPPHFPSQWCTADAVGIAKAMYRSNRFGAMAELADAFEDAGCQDPAILLHCRERYAQHYRGCWVVDGLLQANEVHLGLQ